MFISLDSLINCFAVVSVLYIVFLLLVTKYENIFYWILFKVIGGICALIGIIVFVGHTFFNLPIR